MFTADDAVGRKTVQVSIQSVPLSITLTVTPLSGQAPITPNWSTRRSGGQAPFTWVIYWGDGTSDDVSNCSQNCPSHTYTIPGTYTITLKVTDASGKTASDSKTITVYGAPNSTSTTSSSTQPPPQPPPFPPQPIPPVACDPTITVVTIIVAILAGIAFIIVFRDWIFGLFGGAAFILAIIVAFFVAAVFIFANGNVCNPVVTILAVIIITVIIVWIVQRPRPRPPPLPPPPLPPPGGNVAGNATVTGPGGGTTQLTNANLNQVGPGSTVETGPGSFVKAPTPQGSNSQSVIGQNSRVSWLDPNFKTQIPWLRFPGLSQIYNLGSLLLRLDFGKLLLSWVQAAATQEAVIILPASLIGAATSAAMSRWLARIKGTMVLVEAAQDGTSAAITVLEGEAGKESSVELWRSDDLNKVIEIHPGERVILNAGRRPTKTSVDLAKGLTQQIQDPFRILQKWWTIPPMSNETNAALKTSGQSSSGTIPGEKTSVCTNCGMKIPSDTKFCSHCGHERKRP